VIGQPLESLDRRGKFLMVSFGAHTAVVHLGMSGRLLLLPTGATPPPHTHLRLCFEGNGDVLLVDPRRFGLVEVVRSPELPSLPYLSSLGPDALDGDVPGALARVLPGSRTPVWGVLLNQRVVAGVGNIYANEALARAGIRPLRRSCELGRAAVGRLAAAIPEVLAEAVAQGGTTLSDGGFVDGGNRTGYFAVHLRVYGREGKPCLHCGACIHRQRHTGRSVFFCPRCQR
jgi:formamidopyrimidine-DNA glycosylase